MTRDSIEETATLRRGNPTPADVYVGNRPLSNILGWDETLACLGRAIARLFAYFSNAQERADRTPLDIFLFEGGWVYAKRDGLAGPVLWLFLLEQLRAARSNHEIVRLEVESGLVVPAEFLRAVKDELGLAAPSPAGFPAHASPEMSDPRDRIGQWRWLLRSVFRVAFSRRPRAHDPDMGKCILISTRSFSKHRYGTMIDDLRLQLGSETRIIGVHPKERPWASDRRYEDSVISPHRGGGLVVLVRAFVMGWQMFMRQRRLAPEMARVDPVLASMLRYRFPHLFHAAVHSLSVERMLKRLRPVAFIRNGNYNTPDERRTNWACRRVGVPSIVVTPRSLSPRMPAMPMNYALEKDSLPKCFVVSDDVSRDMLRKWGVPENAISLGSLEMLVDETDEDDAGNGATDLGEVAVPSALILLDNRFVSAAMINQILQSLPNRDIRLLVRAHPLTPLTSQPEVLEALDGREWTEVTGELLRTVVEKDRTLAFSPCSGVGVDAVRCGAALVWMPYLSSNSPAHVEAILSTGTVCDGEGDLPRHTALLSDPEALARQARDDRTRLRSGLFPSRRPLVDAVCEQMKAQLN